MKHIKTFESFVNESSYADRSMMISADQKDQILDLLKKANLQVKLSQPPEYGGDYEIEFRTPQEALKGEQVLSVLDESRIDEGDMTKEYDGFIASSTDNKISYKFRYQKGMQSNKAENAAFEKMMKETGKPRGSFWVTKLIPKGEFDKDVTPVLEINTNEGNDLSYWAQYAEDKSPQANMNPWMSDECTTMSEVLKCIDKSIAAWNKESEDGPISKADEKWVGNLAIEYWKKFKTINGNIISAMIMQESK